MIGYGSLSCSFFFFPFLCSPSLTLLWIIDQLHRQSRHCQTHFLPVLGLQMPPDKYHVKSGRSGESAAVVLTSYYYFKSRKYTFPSTSLPQQKPTQAYANTPWALVTYPFLWLLLNNVKHFHIGAQMRLWWKMESVPEQPVAAPQPRTCMINTSNNNNSPSSSTCQWALAPHADVRVRRGAAGAGCWGVLVGVGGFEGELAFACIVPKILTELRMNTQALPPPSWLIHQTALASWIPEA